jgi:hypothetical protein
LKPPATLLRRKPETRPLPRPVAPPCCFWIPTAYPKRTGCAGCWMPAPKSTPSWAGRSPSIGTATGRWPITSPPPMAFCRPRPKTRKSNCAHAIHRPRPFGRSRSGRIGEALCEVSPFA